MKMQSKADYFTWQEREKYLGLSKFPIKWKAKIEPKAECLRNKERR
jgi:hypothetical protein